MNAALNNLTGIAYVDARLWDKLGNWACLLALPRLRPCGSARTCQAQGIQSPTIGTQLLFHPRAFGMAWVLFSLV